MDSLNQSAIVTPRSNTKLSRKFAKILRVRSAATNIDNKAHKSLENRHFHEEITEKRLQNKAVDPVMDAFIAEIFATLSSVKATYAELQDAQFPYDPEQIQLADRIIISELERLSELKQSFLKNRIKNSSPERTVLLSEIQEQKNLVKTYDITNKKLVNEIRSKDSEIMFSKQKLEEIERENKLIERRLNSSGPVNVEFTKVTSNDVVSFLKHAVKSVRSFVKLMVTEMEFANWDVDVAARSIHPGVSYWSDTHRCFAFESFVCREMFDGFANPCFSISGSDVRPGDREQLFVEQFKELKYLKAREYITWKPASPFAKFCCGKYIQLVHPKMELSLFGNLNQRNLVVSGKLPETIFFESFSEVAKRLWLLHCVVFSLDRNGASVFRVRNGSRFSEVFMESVNEDAFSSPEKSPEVAFTVVPGLKLGGSVVQCQVYLT